jgi:HSP20 family protein
VVSNSICHNNSTSYYSFNIIFDNLFIRFIRLPNVSFSQLLNQLQTEPRNLFAASKAGTTKQWLFKKRQYFGSVRNFDDLFSRFLGSSAGAVSNSEPEPEAWSIPLDVLQDGDNLVVTASVPCTSKEDINVSVDDNVLTIKAETGESLNKETNGYLLRERRTGSYYRALRLPETVDFENAKSTFKNGVLKIKLPKLESKKARNLEISAA